MNIWIIKFCMQRSHKYKSQDNGVLSSIIWLPSCIVHLGKEG